MCIGTKRPANVAPPPPPVFPAAAPQVTDPNVQSAKETTRKRAALALANQNIATSPLGIASTVVRNNNTKTLLGA